jgi:hypothetical protein
VNPYTAAAVSALVTAVASAWAAYAAFWSGYRSGRRAGYLAGVQDTDWIGGKPPADGKPATRNRTDWTARR